jgi:hypothetical protein
MQNGDNQLEFFSVEVVDSPSQDKDDRVLHVEITLHPDRILAARRRAEQAVAMWRFFGRRGPLPRA